MMEYQKILNFLENTPNQPSKFKTKNWVEINDESHGEYNTSCQIKLKLQSKGQVYVIIVMRTYLSEEL